MDGPFRFNTPNAAETTGGPPKSNVGLQLGAGCCVASGPTEKKVCILKEHTTI